VLVVVDHLDEDGKVGREVDEVRRVDDAGRPEARDAAHNRRTREALTAETLEQRSVQRLVMPGVAVADEDPDEGLLPVEYAHGCQSPFLRLKPPRHSLGRLAAREASTKIRASAVSTSALKAASLRSSYGRESTYCLTGTSGRTRSTRFAPPLAIRLPQPAESHGGRPMRRHLPQGHPRIAVAYLRTSTDEQHPSPEAQRAWIQAWAVREHTLVAGWCEDRGVAASPPSRTGRLCGRPWRRSAHSARACWLSPDAIASLATSCSRPRSSERSPVRTPTS
jgi:Resolvase, N terminal domain